MTYSVSEKYFFARSHLSFLLFTKKMFYTRALIGAIDTWKLDKGQIAPAYIQYGNLITVCIDQTVLDECVQSYNISDASRQMDFRTIEINPGHPIEVSPYVPMFMVFHEIRHIPQFHQKGTFVDQILLPEIVEKYKNGNRPMAMIINICKDMTLHRDILKIPEIKIGFDQLNSLLNEREIKRLLEARNEKNAGEIDKAISEIRGGIRLAILEKFDERFPKPEGYTDYFQENLDWATLTNLAYLRLKEQNERNKEERKKAKQKDQGQDPGDQNESDEGQEKESDEGQEKDSKGSKPKNKKPSKHKLFDDEEDCEGFEATNGFDDHGDEEENPELSEEEREDLRKARQRRLDQAMREAEVVGKEQASKSAGCDAGDMAMFVKERNPDNRIIQLLSKIKSKVQTLSGKPDYEASWKLTRSRGNFCIPTERERGSKKTPAIVLVLDTSGSMWSTEIMEQSFSVARGLMKRGKLAALYQCDTEMIRCDKQAMRATGTIVGGGGTDLGMRQVQQIREDLKVSPGDIIDIVYVTDGYVNLEEIRQDKQTRLHIILNNNGSLDDPSQLK